VTEQEADQGRCHPVPAPLQVGADRGKLPVKKASA
jgi:hypothetical protein